MTRTFALQLTLAAALCVTFHQSARAQSPANSAEIAPVYKVSAQGLDSHPPVPGTLAANATPARKLKPEFPFQVSLERDYRSPWDSNQPLANAKYGAAPVVVTFNVSRKPKAQEK